MARPNDRVLPVDFITADASFSRSVWHFQIPRKFTFADCLDPELWRHNAKLKENDLVDVIGEAGDFDCSLRVLAAERAWSFSASCASGTPRKSPFTAKLAKLMWPS